MAQDPNAVADSLIDGLVPPKPASTPAAPSTPPPSAPDPNSVADSLIDGLVPPRKAAPTPRFKDAGLNLGLVQVANELGIDPDHLARAIHFESGGDPSNTNSHGYTGLIQFGNSAAASVGTTTDALRGMTAEQQLPYVQRYLAQNLRGGKSFGDVYASIAWPAGVGKSDDTVLYAADGSGMGGTPASRRAAYQANKVFDPQGLGYVTKGMMAARAYGRGYDASSGTTAASTASGAPPTMAPSDDVAKADLIRRLQAQKASAQQKIQAIENQAQTGYTPPNLDLSQGEAHYKNVLWETQQQLQKLQGITPKAAPVPLPIPKSLPQDPAGLASVLNTLKPALDQSGRMLEGATTAIAEKSHAVDLSAQALGTARAQATQTLAGMTDALKQFATARQSMLAEKRASLDPGDPQAVQAFNDLVSSTQSDIAAKQARIKAAADAYAQSDAARVQQHNAMVDDLLSTTKSAEAQRKQHNAAVAVAQKAAGQLGDLTSPVAQQGAQALRRLPFDAALYVNAVLNPKIQSIQTHQQDTGSVATVSNAHNPLLMFSGDPGAEGRGEAGAFASISKQDAAAQIAAAIGVPTKALLDPKSPAFAKLRRIIRAGGGASSMPYDPQAGAAATGGSSTDIGIVGRDPNIANATNFGLYTRAFSAEMQPLGQIRHFSDLRASKDIPGWEQALDAAGDIAAFAVTGGAGRGRREGDPRKRRGRCGHAGRGGIRGQGRGAGRQRSRARRRGGAGGDARPAGHRGANPRWEGADVHRRKHRVAGDPHRRPRGGRHRERPRFVRQEPRLGDRQNHGRHRAVLRPAHPLRSEQERLR
jgi:hypothetical protein